jgi:hypothetical protein
MYVAEVSRYAYNPNATKVKLQVVSQGEENKSWAAATPNGSMELNINNEAASALLGVLLGQEVWVDITPVE